jgi:hypothetical protein
MLHAPCWWQVAKTKKTKPEKYQEIAKKIHDKRTQMGQNRKKLLTKVDCSGKRLMQWSVGKLYSWATVWGASWNFLRVFIHYFIGK